jgi:hypothetical protein
MVKEKLKKKDWYKNIKEKDGRISHCTHRRH